MQENPETGQMEWTMKGVTADAAAADLAAARQSTGPRPKRPGQAPEKSPGTESFPYYPPEEDSESDVDLPSDPKRRCFTRQRCATHSIRTSKGM